MQRLLFIFHACLEIFHLLLHSFDLVFEGAVVGFNALTDAANEFLVLSELSNVSCVSESKPFGWLAYIIIIIFSYSLGRIWLQSVSSLTSLHSF